MKMKVHRIHVPEKGCQRNAGEHRFCGLIGRNHSSGDEVLGKPQRKTAFCSIARQRQHCGNLVAGAQDIGCPGIARTIVMRVRQTHETADHNGK